MIAGVGIDLVEISRVRRALERRGETIEREILAPEERCGADASLERRARTLARAFAAKEAALKALGTGWGRGVGWHDVRLVEGALAFHGGARVRAAEMGVTSVHVSCSLSRTHASGAVLLER